MGKFATSWALTKASLQVVRQDKELLWLPVLSVLASIATFLLVSGVGLGLALIPGVRGDPLAFAWLAVVYLALAFVQVYFAAAVMEGAHQRLTGGDPTVNSAMRAAWAKKGRIFAWSVVVATVNLILSLLRERGGGAGRVAAAVGSIAWTIATYFVLPVILFENLGVGGSMDRSRQLLKKSWGESIIGSSGIGLVFGLCIFAIILLVALVVMTAGPLVGLPLVVLAFVAILVLASLSFVVQGVYRTALYRYATTGQAGGPFTPEQMVGAFTTRKA